MQKIKVLLLSLVLFFGSVAFVNAIQKSVSIQDLPEYITSNSFYLSCSALGGNSVVFEYKKDGGSYQNLGSIDVTTTQCQIMVDSSKINEETKYYFKVTLDGEVTDETSTNYDVSGPSSVSNYKKDGASGNNIVLHWKNPNNSDFSKVIIYRGESSDFTADGNHEIATVYGSPDSEMTHTVNVPDNSKTYYYLIRALDKAGNSSGLVGDVSTTTTVSTPSASQNGSGKVTVLPKTSGSGGQVLGTESEKIDPTATPSPTNSDVELTEGKVSSSNNNTYYYGAGLLVLGLILYLFFKSRK